MASMALLTARPFLLLGRSFLGLLTAEGRCLTHHCLLSLFRLIPRLAVLPFQLPDSLSEQLILLTQLRQLAPQLLNDFNQPLCHQPIFS